MGQRRPVDVLRVPSNLGLGPDEHGRPRGVDRLADALVGHGVTDGLWCTDDVRIAVPAWSPARDPALLVRNAGSIADVADRTAEALVASRARGRFVLVLGGDCSILLGTALGLRRLGRYALAFLDGHTDFYLPREDHAGGVAGMDLALVTGRGPRALCDWHGATPLVEDALVTTIGHRDDEEARRLRMPSIAVTDIAVVGLEDTRRIGAGAVARMALARAESADGLFVHLDVDVLDDRIMPAVDSRQPDGLTYPELSEVLEPLLADPRTVGLQVAIYDPDRDPGGECGRRLARELNAVLRRCLS